MARLRPNFQSGAITDNPLSSGATTINSAEFASLEAVTGSDTLALVLDPDQLNGAPEIVTVTAHTASATSVTVTRAAEGTSARSHSSGEKWIVAALSADFDHGNLDGLADDDHTQYLTTTRHDAISHTIGDQIPAPSVVTDISATGTVGTSSAPARENHAHALAVDGSTIEYSGGAIRVKDAGLTTAKYGDATITQAKLASGYRATYANSSAPGSPIEGDLWWDTTNNLLYVYDGAEWVRVQPSGAEVDTSEQTTTTSFTDLSTSGPAVTLLTGTKVIVAITAQIANSGSNSTDFGFAVSGATTLAANDNDSVADIPPTVTVTRSGVFIVTGLTAGSNTFTMKYKVAGGTGTFQRRNIVVTPIT